MSVVEYRVCSPSYVMPKCFAGRYLINRYLGTFLDDTISLDQLSVDGAISLSNVALNIRTINSMIGRTTCASSGYSFSTIQVCE